MDGATRLWLWIACIDMTIGVVIFGSKAAAMRNKEGMFDPRKLLYYPYGGDNVPDNGFRRNGKTSEWTRSFQRDVT